MVVRSGCILLIVRVFILLGSTNPGLLFESVVHILNQDNLNLMIYFFIKWGNLNLSISKVQQPNGINFLLIRFEGLLDFH